MSSWQYGLMIDEDNRIVLVELYFDQNKFSGKKPILIGAAYVEIKEINDEETLNMVSEDIYNQLKYGKIPKISEIGKKNAKKM